MSLWVQIAPGVNRRIAVDGERLMVVEVRFEAGASVPMHSHIHEQATHVIEGQLRFRQAESPDVILEPGQTMHIPSNIVHSAEAVSACTVIDIFSPPREDFRAKP